MPVVIMSQHTTSRHPVSRHTTSSKLFLVGIGISDEKGISLRGLETLQACEKIFAEHYTNRLPENTLVRLEALCEKKIEILGREDVEGEKVLLESASSVPTALIVDGDPMIATTHISLLLAAKKRGIGVEVVHSSSILSAAIGESGLQAYKFGKIVTLAYWRENGKIQPNFSSNRGEQGEPQFNYKPMTAYDIISENLSRNLHTLLLLDIDEKLGTMPPAHAASLLSEMENIGEKKILLPETKIVLLQGLGWSEPVRKYETIAQISKHKSTSAPAILIIPAKLHFIEEEFLTSL